MYKNIIMFFKLNKANRIEFILIIIINSTRVIFEYVRIGLNIDKFTLHFYHFNYIL